MKTKPTPHVIKKKCTYDKKQQTTLDACHQKKLVQFEENQQTIRSISDDIAHLEKRLMEHKDKRAEWYAKSRHQDWDNMFKSLEKDLERARIVHSQLLEESDEIEYYTRTADILYSYYESLEKHHTPLATAPAPVTPPSKRMSSKGAGGASSKSILDYLQSGGKKPASEDEPSFPTPHQDAKDEPSVAAAAEAEADSLGAAPHLANKADLYEKYLYMVDQNYVKESNDAEAQMCEHCHSEDVTAMLHDGLLYCNQCHTVRYLIVDNDKPSYKEPQKEISYLNYKRKNHFNEWLNQIQGKETTDIPEKIFNDILLEIKKLQITNLADLTHAKIRDILKKLRYNKYYEHTPYIYYMITGIPNQYLSQELEDKLRNMFEQIQVPFLKHAPAARKNFLSYSYAIHKMLQLLGEDKYLKYFPLLKNREKLHQQEQIWAKICEELNWQVIKSI